LSYSRITIWRWEPPLDMCMGTGDSIPRGNAGSSVQPSVTSLGMDIRSCEDETCFHGGLKPEISV